MGGHNNNNQQQQPGPRPPNRMQTFDSSGPSVKIRGNAYQVFERYIALAREAASSGDRIAAENLYQHAEHYFRDHERQRRGQNHGPPRPMTPADTEMNGMTATASSAKRATGRNGSRQPQPERRTAAAELGDVARRG